MKNLGYLALTVFASNGMATNFHKTTKSSCLILPPVNDALIINRKTGDQTEPGARGIYQYNYAYKKNAEIVLTKENKEGELVHTPIRVADNKVSHFKGKKIEHVRNLTQNFIESKKFHQCE